MLAAQTGLPAVPWWFTTRTTRGHGIMLRAWQTYFRWLAGAFISRRRQELFQLALSWARHRPALPIAAPFIFIAVLPSMLIRCREAYPPILFKRGLTNKNAPQ